MLTIPIAFYLVMLELSIGSFLVLFALDARNDTSIGFVRFQGVLYLILFTLLTWATLNGFANTTLLRDSLKFNLDYRWLHYQGPLLFWFMILQIPYNALLLFAKDRRLARLLVGGLVAALGFADLLVVGIGFHAIAAGVLGGLPTVAAFVAGALSLGGVSTAMLLGHWYLNTPTASGKPLEFATMLTIIGILAQITFGLLGGPVTYVKPTATAAPPTISAVTAQPVIERVVLPRTVTSPTPSPTATPGAPSAVPSGVRFNSLTLAILEYLIGFGLPLVLSLIAWAVIPFDAGMVIADINVGVLYLFAISSLGVYGVIMSGWASNSKYAFLGALRSAAQMVSYEVSIGFVIITVLLCVGSLNLSDVVEAQRTVWFAIPLLPMFVVFFISALAETNRAPFDLPEGESELVAGYFVEYSSMSFALFFLGEYANMILMSGITAVLFLGGWLPPFDIAPFNWIPGPIWFALKIAALLFVFLWVRATFPRYRYDQLMRLGWKVFLPLSLLWVVLTAGVLVAFDMVP